MKIRILNLDQYKSLFKDEESFKEFVAIIIAKVEDEFDVIVVTKEIAFALLKKVN